MMFIGLALHVTAAVFLALHVVDSRRSLWWLAALFLVPLLASALYFLGVFLPELRFERRVRQLVARGRTVSPQRQAQFSFEEAPSLENRLRLAASLLEAGAVDEALVHGGKRPSPAARDAAAASIRAGPGARPSPPGAACSGPWALPATAPPAPGGIALDRDRLRCRGCRA